MTIQAFINTNRIRMSADWADNNPNMFDMPGGSSHWRCVLRMGRKQMTTFFSMGPAHSSEPTTAEVLDCLASDALGFINAQSFEDWASEYGFDTDSRKAERTFHAVKRAAARLEAFLGADLYRELTENTERM